MNHQVMGNVFETPKLDARNSRAQAHPNLSLLGFFIDAHETFDDGGVRIGSFEFWMARPSEEMGTSTQSSVDFYTR